MLHLVLVLSCTAEVGSFPIPPQPLRWLYLDSDLVVVAKAGKIERLATENEFHHDSKVVLTIEKTLKGNCEGTQATVYTAQNIECPAPDRYPEGKTLLVFLNWSGKLKGYEAPGLSYASKALDGRALDLHVRRLEALAKIPAEKTGEHPSDETIEWLVQCLEEPITRWDASYEFAGGADAPKDDDSGRKLIPLRRLTKRQLLRIADACAAIRSLDVNDLLMLNMLKDFPDPRVDAVVVAALRRELAEEQPDLAGTLMKVLAGRSGLKEAAALASLYAEAKDHRPRLELLRKFLGLIKKD